MDAPEPLPATRAPARRSRTPHDVYVARQGVEMLTFGE